MNFREYIISEASLSYPVLMKHDYRIQKFVDMLVNKQPFKFLDGTTQTIDADRKWLKELQVQIANGLPPPRFTFIPLASGDKLLLNKILKSEEFGGKPGVQPGGDFEDLLYNQIKDITQDGPVLLQIKNKVYKVTGIEPPAKASKVKADLVIHTEDSNLYISLKEPKFPSYAGVASTGSRYQQKLAHHPLVVKYIEKLKKFLIKKGLCRRSDGMIECERGETDYHYIPNDRELNMEDFANFAIFGDREFEDELNYVDYVITGETSEQPFEENNGKFVLSRALKVFKRGELVDGSLKPAFLTRKSIGRSSYGIADARTSIVPVKEAEARGIDIETGQKSERNKKLKVALRKANQLVARSTY